MVKVLAKPTTDRTDAVGETLPGDPIAAFEARHHVRGAERRGEARRQDSAEDADRRMLLGLILASLPGVPIEDAAALLKVGPMQLEKMLHGTAVKARYEHDWQAVAEILRLLHTVLRPSATGRWLKTPIPALKGETPLSAVQQGKIGDVLRVVHSYRETSFS